MVGKQVVQFWQVVSSFVHTMFQLSTKSHFEASVSCFISQEAMYTISHTCITIDFIQGVTVTGELWFEMHGVMEFSGVSGQGQGLGLVGVPTWIQIVKVKN